MLDQFFPFFLSVAIVVLYLLPMTIAFNRRVAVPGAVAIVSLLLGWTIIGWVGCLFWATFGPVASVKRDNFGGSAKETPC